MNLLIISGIVLIIGIVIIAIPFINTLTFYIKEFSKNKNQAIDEIKYKERISSLGLSEEFEEIYNELYNSNYRELEVKRKKCRNRHLRHIVIVIGLILSAFGVVLIGFNIIIGIISLAIFGIIMFLFIVSASDFNKHMKEYVDLFKNNIIKHFTQNIYGEVYYKYAYSNSDYIEDNIVAKKLYDEAMFNGEKSVSMHCTDYIMADLDCNLKAIIMDVKDKTRVFEGVFTFVENSKNILDKICIVKNNAGEYSAQKVKLDSENFEKYFDVYSENKILTMQLLTSDVMELIVDFYNKFDLQFEIVIKENGMYVRFVTGNLLEPRIYRKSMNEKELFIYYSVLEFINDLSKSINKALNELDI